MWGLATGRDIQTLTPKSSDQLIHEPFKARVGIEKSREYDDKNKIRNFIMPAKSPVLEGNGTDLMSDDSDYDDTAPF